MLHLYSEGILEHLLEKFERIMFECEILECEILECKWTFYLTTKLPERLCVRVGPLIDNNADFHTIKASLLESDGETESTFGFRLLSIISDTLKSMTTTQIVEYVHRLAKGLFLKAQSRDDYLLTITKAVIKQHIPTHGKTFLESRDIMTYPQLCKAMIDWLNTRMR